MKEATYRDTLPPLSRRAWDLRFQETLRFGKGLKRSSDSDKNHLTDGYDSSTDSVRTQTPESDTRGK
jgi:hypothetical protein